MTGHVVSFKRGLILLLAVALALDPGRFEAATLSQLTGTDRNETFTFNADGTATSPTGFFLRLLGDDTGFEIRRKDGFFVEAVKILTHPEAGRIMVRRQPEAGGALGHRSRVLVLCIVSLLTGCPATSSTSSSSGPSPTPSPVGPIGNQSPGAGPYSAISEILLVDPKNPTVRARLVATARESRLPTNVRYAALNRLELAPPVADTVGAAETVARSVAGNSEEERWLVLNAIATLGRAQTDESRRALAALAQDTTVFKREAASTLGRPQ